MKKPITKWFVQQRLRNCPSSGDTIKIKAKEENKMQFNASDDFLNKQRYGIRNLKITVSSISTIGKSIYNPIFKKKIGFEFIGPLNLQWGRNCIISLLGSRLLHV